ncbi:MAG: ABC transporter ATP-binding protein [Flavobacteriales bacterium]|nr:ABC transporter ATP-binding protein [Flavobacteriales bacterium]
MTVSAYDAIVAKEVSKEFQLGQARAPGMGRYMRNLFAADSREENAFWALRDVSFNIEKGQAVGIIGNNGAGKSTLLKILSRIMEPTTGRIEVVGRVSSLLEVGTGFHPELTGRENIFLNGTIMGMTRAEVKAKFDQIVEFSGLGKFIDTPVKRYSSGMYVRLAFAVGAHLNPDILIIDEVLAVGDADFQKKCLGKMDEIVKHGRTVLFVSHNLGAVKAFCTKAMLLRSGRLEMFDDRDKVVGSYLAGLAEKDAVIGLEERTNREGNGQFLIVRIRMISMSDGLETTTVTSGSPVRFEITYKHQASGKPSSYEVEAGLAIYNGDNQFVTALNNRMAGAPFKHDTSTGTLVCELEPLPFMYGEFSVLATLKVNKEIADSVEHAFRFTVLRGDFYGSGYPNDGSRQGVYVPQKWGIKKSGNDF